MIEGFQWGGQLMITSDVETIPATRTADGTGDDGRLPTAGERFGAEFITDDVTKVDFSEQPLRVWVKATSTRRAP